MADPTNPGTLRPRTTALVTGLQQRPRVPNKLPVANKATLAAKKAPTAAKPGAVTTGTPTTLSVSMRQGAALNQRKAAQKKKALAAAMQKQQVVKGNEKQRSSNAFEVGSKDKAAANSLFGPQVNDEKKREQDITQASSEDHNRLYGLDIPRAAPPTQKQISDFLDSHGTAGSGLMAMMQKSAVAQAAPVTATAATATQGSESDPPMALLQPNGNGGVTFTPSSQAPAYSIGGQNMGNFIDHDGNFNWGAFIAKLQEDNFAHAMLMLIMSQVIQHNTTDALNSEMGTQFELTQGSVLLNRANVSLDMAQDLTQFDLSRGNEANKLLANLNPLTPTPDLSLWKVRDKEQSRGPITDELRRYFMRALSGDKNVGDLPLGAAQKNTNKEEILDKYKTTQTDREMLQRWNETHDPSERILLNRYPGDTGQLDLTVMSPEEVAILRKIDQANGTDFAKRYAADDGIERHFYGNRNFDVPGRLRVLTEEQAARRKASQDADAQATQLEAKSRTAKANGNQPEADRLAQEAKEARTYAQVHYQRAESLEPKVRYQRNLYNTLIHQIEESPEKVNNQQLLGLKQHIDEYGRFIEDLTKRIESADVHLQDPRYLDTRKLERAQRADLAGRKTILQRHTFMYTTDKVSQFSVVGDAYKAAESELTKVKARIEHVSGMSGDHRAELADLHQAETKLTANMAELKQQFHPVGKLGFMEKRFLTGESQEAFDKIIAQHDKIQANEITLTQQREDLTKRKSAEENTPEWKEAWKNNEKSISDNKLEKTLFNIKILEAKANTLDHHFEAMDIWNRWNKAHEGNKPNDQTALFNDIRAGKYAHVDADIMSAHAKTMAAKIDKHLKAAEQAQEPDQAKVKEWRTQYANHIDQINYWRSDAHKSDVPQWPKPAVTQPRKTRSTSATTPGMTDLKPAMRNPTEHRGDYEFEGAGTEIDESDPEQIARRNEATAEGGHLGLMAYHDKSEEGLWGNLNVWNQAMSRLQSAFTSIQQYTEGDPLTAAANASGLSSDIISQVMSTFQQYYTKIQPMLSQLAQSVYKPPMW